jgi:hypothetical protein
MITHGKDYSLCEETTIQPRLNLMKLGSRRCAGSCGTHGVRSLRTHGVRSCGTASSRSCGASCSRASRFHGSGGFHGSSGFGCSGLGGGASVQGCCHCDASDHAKYVKFHVLGFPECVFCGKECMRRHARDDYDTHGVNDNRVNSRKYCGGYPIGPAVPTVTQTGYGI